MSVRRAGREDRGSAAVEFALVLPLLLLLIFGIIDFGRMLNAKITINEAAREGARAAALAGTGEASARIAMVTQGMPVSVSISGCPSSPDPSADATVTITHQFQFITPVNVLAGFAAPTLEATGVMPCLQ
jgi:Flp pilus assembly protein TadG